MQSVLHLANLWDNPVFHRYRRSQLRTKKAIFWYLATLIITTFVVMVTYLGQTNFGNASGEGAARRLWMPLLVIQGLILLLKGTGRTASGLVQDKLDQTLDYQRLTPVSPLRNVIGYLFGLPVLEYTMFALTLPHLAFIVVKGNIPLATVFTVYLIFFVCAIFYHMTAVAVGMVMKRWIWGYLLSIFSVAFLNLILPTLASQLGLRFLQYLSIFPVIGQKVVPLMGIPIPPGPPPQFGQGPFGPQPLGPGRGGPPGQFGPPGSFGPPGQAGQQGEANLFGFGDPVSFFEWTVSPFWFTLVLQSSLIVTFATMAIRRWQKESRHSLSKPYALGILVAFIVLATGNLWPVITGESLPFMILGSNNIDELSEILAISLPMIYTIAVWLLCLFLFANVVPTHHDYLRGVRRARKLGRPAARPWDDDAAHIPFMSLFVVIALAGYWLLYSEMTGAGYLSFLEGTGFPEWRLPLVFGLVLFYSFFLLQVLEQRGTVLTVLLVWLLPILAAIVMSAALQALTPLQSVIASLSPLATIIASGILPSTELWPIDEPTELTAIRIGAWTGIVFLIAQIAFLWWRWGQLRTKLH
jgi:hypothetical protein